MPKTKTATLSSDEILQIIQSAIKQAAHPMPSPETIARFDDLSDRINGIEKIIYDHASSETDILKGIQDSVAHIISDQSEKHKTIEHQLSDLKPISDGMAAAVTLRSLALWIGGFVFALSGSIVAIKQIWK